MHRFAPRAILDLMPARRAVSDVMASSGALRTAGNSDNSPMARETSIVSA